MTSLVMAGVSYRSVPLPFLERCRAALPSADALPAVLRAHGCDEVVPLSTCSRQEVYAVVGGEAGRGRVVSLLAAICGVEAAELDPLVDVRRGPDVVTHLSRVAAGLDSRIVGEVDIHDQVAAAHRSATQAGTAGRELSRLFARATRTARRVQHDTELGRLGRSLGTRAVDVGLAATGRSCPDVALAGSGRMATVAARRLAEAGIVPIVYSRRPEQGTRLTGDPGRSRPFDTLPAGLTAVDLLICSTSAPGHIVSAATVRRAMTHRPGRPLVLVDLSLPRTVDDAVAGIGGVRLFDLEGIDEDGAERADVQRAVDAGEAIVAREAARYLETGRTGRAGPVIAALKARAEARCLDELLHAAGASNPSFEMVRAARAAAAKLVHEPILAIRRAAALGDGEALASFGASLVAHDLA